jgi:tripartite-type tricarboxylate transporter receptor subunit TctC
MKKIVAAIMVAMLFASNAFANFPNKTVRIITSLPVGSGPDTTARKLAEVLSEKWKVPVIIENRPGGSGGIALDVYNREAADGHAIGYFDAGSIVGYPIMYNKPDSVATIEPVLPCWTVYLTLFASTQIKDFAALKEEIAKNPTYGSWANGSAGHLAGASFSSLFDVNMTHIVYKEYGAWLVDTSNKIVTYGFGSIGSTKGLVQLGKLQYMGIIAARRDPGYPSVPTIKELTGKDLPEPPSWLAFFIHKNVPANVKKQIELDMRDAAADPRVKEVLSRLDYTSYGNMSLNDFNLQINRQVKEFNQMSQKFNITVK